MTGRLQAELEVLDDEHLAEWLATGLDFAGTLPPEIAATET